MPVQAWGIGIDLARGRLDEPAPPVAADNAGGQAWAEPAGCGRGLHDGGAAGALEPYDRAGAPPGAGPVGSGLPGTSPLS